MEEAGDDFVWRARGGGNGVDRGHHRFLLATALLALAQAHLGLCRSLQYYRHPFAIGLNDQDSRFFGGRGRRLLGIEGFCVSGIGGYDLLQHASG